MDIGPKTLKTQKWKGARPNFNRRASWRSMLENQKPEQLTKNKSLPNTETTKYKTRASDDTLVFNQEQTDSVPTTKNTQMKRCEVSNVDPNTEIKIPIIIVGTKSLKLQDSWQATISVLIEQANNEDKYKRE